MENTEGNSEEKALLAEVERREQAVLTEGTTPF